MWSINIISVSGLYGHTAVLHSDGHSGVSREIYQTPGVSSLSSIYVYGGILPLHPYAQSNPNPLTGYKELRVEETEGSNELWVLNLKDSKWSVLSPTAESPVSKYYCNNSLFLDLRGIFLVHYLLVLLQ